mmetsp:Transcript_101941/g.172727  ORF Transcript_101941/g.172727 Transcript_101941/m.172727 type:complete len:219 (+) Transcript_101941:505-1161(+)
MVLATAWTMALVSMAWATGWAVEIRSMTPAMPRFGWDPLFASLPEPSRTTACKAARRMACQQSRSMARKDLPTHHKSLQAPKTKTALRQTPASCYLKRTTMGIRIYPALLATTHFAATFLGASGAVVMVHLASVGTGASVGMGASVGTVALVLTVVSMALVVWGILLALGVLVASGVQPIRPALQAPQTPRAHRVQQVVLLQLEHVFRLLALPRCHIS